MLESLLDELKPKEEAKNTLDNLIRQFVGGMVDSGRIDPTPVPKVETPADVTDLLRSIATDMRVPEETEVGAVERADILCTLTEIMSVVAEMPTEEPISEVLESVIAQEEPVENVKQEALAELTSVMTAIASEVDPQSVVTQLEPSVMRVESEVSVSGLSALIEEMRGLVAILKAQASAPKSEYKPVTGFEVVYPQLGSRNFEINIKR